MVAVTLLTGVLLFCSVFFLVQRANREITQRSFDELATATRQIAKDLVDAANADQTILSAMAERIAGHDERDNDAVLRIMKSFSLSETFVSTVALLRPDGTLLLTDGTRYDVSDTFDFETEAARGAYISDRVTSYFAPEKLVVRNVVPVVRDGETVAILYGVVLLQELSRNYQIDLYNGNAFLLLVDGNNGDILLDTWHDSLGNISELRGRKMLKGYTYEEAMKKIPNGIGGDMCTVSRSTGLTVYLHYEPVGINNWSVVLGVSEAEALAGTRGVVQTLSMMAIIVTALLLSYLGFMVWYLASARRGVYRMSITDQGTGLMNRVEVSAQERPARHRSGRLHLYRRERPARDQQRARSRGGRSAAARGRRASAGAVSEGRSLPRRRRRVRRVSRAGGRGGIRGADAGGF